MSSHIDSIDLAVRVSLELMVDVSEWALWWTPDQDKLIALLNDYMPMLMETELHDNKWLFIAYGSNTMSHFELNIMHQYIRDINDLMMEYGRVDPKIHAQTDATWRAWKI